MPQIDKIGYFVVMYELFKSNTHPIDLDEKFHLFGRSNILRINYWNCFFGEIENLENGLIVECGVGRGRSLIILLALEEFFANLKSREKGKSTDLIPLPDSLSRRITIFQLETPRMVNGQVRLRVSINTHLSF